MNNFTKAIAAGVALAAIFVTTTQAAFTPYSLSQIHKDYPSLGAHFNDEDLYEAIRLDTARSIENELHLQPGWTGNDYARADALRRLTQFRERFDAAPGFTRDQLVNADAAHDVNSFMRNRQLQAHFTQADLIRSVGRAKAVQEGFKGQVEPLGAADYAELAGKSIAAEFAGDWHLSAQWSFEELRAVVGPERAARLARQYKIRAGMSHAELVAAIGRSSAADYAARFHAPSNFTVDEIVQKTGEHELVYIRQDFKDESQDAFNEDHLLNLARARSLRNLQMTYADLSGNFTEREVFEYLVKDSDAEMRRRYGFEGPYTEADVAQASAETTLAETRLTYKLPRHFNDQQLDEAMRKVVRYEQY